MNDSKKMQSTNDDSTASGPSDVELTTIVDEEERVLERVLRTANRGETTSRAPQIDYDAELLALRDQIQDARLEDIPPLVEEMERLQQVAMRRAKVAEGAIDTLSPYFGRLILEQDERRREVLIGRSTFLDSKTGVRIVDWRDAPVSRIFYRYEEGDDYDETFGGRDVEGEVLVRRSLAIQGSKLKRIQSPQGVFARRGGQWARLGQSATELSGGQGAAMRPEAHQAVTRGQLGVMRDEGAEDKHLSEITALIDPRQFELISRPTSGLVVIQGGAGSGKTTIGLHRLAYLAFQDKHRFRTDAMLVVVFNDALVRYISRVLPALGVAGVRVITYEDWISRLRTSHVANLPKGYQDDTPSVVVRFKKHPAMLKMVDAFADSLIEQVDQAYVDIAKKVVGGANLIRVWKSTKGEALAVRAQVIIDWLGGDESRSLSADIRHQLERVAQRAIDKGADLANLWFEVLTDEQRTNDVYSTFAADDFSAQELRQALGYCAKHCAAILQEREEIAEQGGPKVRSVDGNEDRERVYLDREDDAILLRLHQRILGPARSRRGRPLKYQHIFIDETQDLSPIELATILDTATKEQSVTLAGDVAQRLYMENGFTTWENVLEQLELDHVSVEPLKLSYRSTEEILEFATDVLGPLRNEVTGRATRRGAPVEAFRFLGSGEAVAFLSEALRNLARAEPLASVAVIARHPEQADLYYKGLIRGEVPNLRRISEQDFPFKAGVDVTDVKQVKGLEFDYVVLVEANAASYPADDESRHLLHIAATRAAHQLWVVSSGTPSMLIPERYRDE